MIIPSKGITNNGEEYECYYAQRVSWYTLIVNQTTREYSSRELARLGQGWQLKTVSSDYHFNSITPFAENGICYLSIDIYACRAIGYIVISDIGGTDIALPSTRLSEIDEYLELASTPELLVTLTKAVEEVKLAARLLDILP